MPPSTTLLFALLGGVLPALLWLWFWLKEDRARPEPRGLIMLAFISGMITVPLVIPLQQMAQVAESGGVVIFLWAAIEEIMKYWAGFVVVLRRKAVDEPLDPIIYMITVALGFAALENTLFLLNPAYDIFDGIITGNLRFLGATLLHVLASAVVGLSMSLTFYRSKRQKHVFLFVALGIAIILHSLFNYFILVSKGGQILTVFVYVWIGIVALLLIFEKVKRIRSITT